MRSITYSQSRIPYTGVGSLELFDYQNPFIRSRIPYTGGGSLEFFDYQNPFIRTLEVQTEEGLDMTAYPDEFYGISRVHYNRDKTHIVSVKVCQVKDGKFGKEKVWRRARVVSAIEKGLRFWTLLKDSSRKWRVGEEVSILRVKYLRTHPNDEPSDDLGALDTF